VGEGREVLDDRPRRARVRSPRLEVGEEARLARVVDRERRELRVERGGVEGGTDLGALARAVPEELLDPRDGPAGAERGLEPSRARGVAGEVAAKGLAERAREGVAPVDLPLFEAPPARERVLPQHSVAEGVDGGNRRAVERVERALELLAALVVERPVVARAELFVGRLDAPAVEERLEGA